MQVHRGLEVAGLAQDSSGVAVQLSNGETMRVRYLAGADGGRSVIRKAAGIAFPGWDATRSSPIAEVEVTGETPAGMRIDQGGGPRPVPHGGRPDHARGTRCWAAACPISTS